jgi:coatomer subunit beta'
MVDLWYVIHHTICYEMVAANLALHLCVKQCACGDGQYIIYTALKLANKSFGDAMEFCWASDSGVYATRESSSKIKVFKSFKQHKQFRPPFAAEGIFGGALLGVRSGEFIDFYDWAECRIVRRIDVCPRKVYWSESGDVVVLACDTSFYVLRYNRDLVTKYFDQGVEAGEQGIDKAFDLEEEVQEKVRNGHFVGDCFIYTNSGNRLNYYVGGETMTLAHLGIAPFSSYSSLTCRPICNVLVVIMSSIQINVFVGLLTKRESCVFDG